MSYWEPDDGPELPEGWMSEDDVAELQALLKYIDYPDPFPRPGNKSDAALILLDHLLNPPLAAAPVDPHVVWAKTLLGL